MASLIPSSALNPALTLALPFTPTHAQVVAELNRARTELETEGRATQLGKLCATPFGVDIVGITEFVALIGALVGGELDSNNVLSKPDVLT